MHRKHKFKSQPKKIFSKVIVSPFILLVRLYQLLISPLTPAACRYDPTCSTYMINALKIHGLFHGGYLGLRRILRCHPWGKSGYDPVPEKKHSHKH